VNLTLSNNGSSGLIPGLGLGGLRQRVTTLWQSRKHCRWFAQVALARGWPERILHFGVGPGDDLLCTAVMRELKKRGHKKIWMMSKNPELFVHNPDVDQVVPIDYRFREYAWVWGKKWQLLEYARIDLEKDRSEPPQRHILAELCGRLGVRGEISLRPYLQVTEEEVGKVAWARDRIAIQSSGLGGQMLMRNKQWFPERFQEVVDHFRNRVQFVQLGSAIDPLLEGVTDLRGKTRIRESAAVLANARVFVGNVGFLMHLARAVECPSAIIFGGREAPWQSGYGCNVNLYSAEPCAPCWLWNKCDYERVCMDKISSDDVIQAIEQLLLRPRNPLVVDRATV
jgi:ADP-heptose:LPS heptosyltransferase